MKEEEAISLAKESWIEEEEEDEEEEEELAKELALPREMLGLVKSEKVEYMVGKGVLDKKGAKDQR